MTLNQGFVGPDRSEPVLRAARTLRRSTEVAKADHAVSALVMHHHVMPGRRLDSPEIDRPSGLAHDAGELVSQCHEYEVDLILHGHQHLPFIGAAARVAECALSTPELSAIRQPVWVLCAGSAG